MLKLLFGDESKGYQNQSENENNPNTNLNDIDPGNYSFHILTLLEENKNISSSNKKLFTKFDWSSVNRLNIEGHEDYLWYKQDNHLLLAVPNEKNEEEAKNGNTDTTKTIKNDASKGEEKREKEETEEEAKNDDEKKAYEYIEKLLNSMYKRLKDRYLNGYLKITKVNTLKQIETYQVESRQFENNLKSMTNTRNDVSDDFKEVYKIIGKPFGNEIVEYLKYLKDDKVKKLDEDVGNKSKVLKRIKIDLFDEMKKTFIGQIQEIREEQTNKFIKDAERYLNNISRKKRLSKLKGIKFYYKNDKKKNYHKIYSKIVFINVELGNVNDNFHSIEDIEFINVNVKKWNENVIFLTKEELKNTIKVRNETNECGSKLKNIVNVSKRLLDTQDDYNTNNKRYPFPKNTAMEAHIYNFFSKELMDLIG